LRHRWKPHTGETCTSRLLLLPGVYRTCMACRMNHCKFVV
jgi:hypothetical protein